MAAESQADQIKAVEALLEMWTQKVQTRWESERDEVLAKQQEVLDDAMSKQARALERVAEEVRWVDDENLRVRGEDKTTAMDRVQAWAPPERRGGAVRLYSRPPAYERVSSCVLVCVPEKVRARTPTNRRH